MGFAAIFFAVFLAELGDKTQIASAAFAAGDPGRAWKVFAASSLAFVIFDCGILVLHCYQLIAV